MQYPDRSDGLSELRAARRINRGLMWSAGLFSIFINLLALTGPLFMLQIYDRVLGSRSEETLLALFVLMAFLFLMMGILEWARGRVLARIGARFQAHLDRRVFNAILRRAAVSRNQAEMNNQLQDLGAVQRLFASPVFGAMFDIPWTPIFLLGIFIFHPYLGYLAISGGVLLISIALINQWTSRAPLRDANRISVQAEAMAEQMRTGSDTIQALGMRKAAYTRWVNLCHGALRSAIRAGDRGGYPHHGPRRELPRAFSEH